MSTVDNKTLYYSSMIALAYLQNGPGLPISEFTNQYIMVFDLNSTQETTHDFIHPELTKLSLFVELQFDASLAHNIKKFFLQIKITKTKFHFESKTVSN